MWSLLSLKEMYNEEHKLIRLRSELREKEKEMVNFFRVAANPTVSKSNIMIFISIYNVQALWLVKNPCFIRV